jgi:hypothetical protein
MHWFDYFLICWFLLGLTLMAVQVGKPRKPIDGSTLAVAIVIDAAIIAGIALTAGAR